MTDSDSLSSNPKIQEAIQKRDDVLQLQRDIEGVTNLISNLVDGPLERTRRGLFTDTRGGLALLMGQTSHGPDYHLKQLEEVRDLMLDTRVKLVDYYEGSTKELLEVRAKNVEKLRARQEEDDDAYEAHTKKSLYS